MPAMAERRTSSRTACTGFVQLTRIHREESMTAELTDFSNEGLGFVSAVEYKPGSSLRVQLETVESTGSERFAYRLDRSVGIVEVKWCRPTGNRWDRAYATGVKFLLL